MRWVLGVVACLGVGVLGAAAQEAPIKEPKSTYFTRVKVLSESELAITIEHNDRGRKNAFKYAGEHCARYGRIAVYQTGTTSVTYITVSTWACAKPDGGE